MRRALPGAILRGAIGFIGSRGQVECARGRVATGTNADDLHLVITDSGLGGLAICAAIEREARVAAQGDRPPGDDRRGVPTPHAEAVVAPEAATLLSATVGAPGAAPPHSAAPAATGTPTPHSAAPAAMGTPPPHSAAPAATWTPYAHPTGSAAMGTPTARPTVGHPAGGSPRLRITYVNAWPEDGRGYNSLPDPAARAAVFDRALATIDQMRPDRILIACNTLSILYGLTEHARRAHSPVQGIVDAGVELFLEALRADPDSALLVLGTKTTVESGAHRDSLIAAGIAPNRIATVACPGLATAIERTPGGRDCTDLIERFADEAGRLVLPGRTVLAGLCCTHFGYIADELGAALARRLEKPVRTLDPNDRLVAIVARDLFADSDVNTDGTCESEMAGANPCSHQRASPRITVEVISKVVLNDETRRGIGRLVALVSESTARALVFYSHVPDLF